MEQRKNSDLSLKEKDILRNYNENLNNINKKSTFDSKRFLNLKKLNIRRRSILSKKTCQSSDIVLKLPNTESTKFPEFLHNKVKQYELHPFRRPNLKIVGEDLKYRLFEMNEKNNIEKINETKEKELMKVYSNDEFVDKGNNLNNNFKIEENKNKQKKQENREDNLSREIIKLKIPKEKKKKAKKNTSLELESKFLNKYRKINRVKNLYDSNDDDESEEEKEDEYVINPESKIIIIFDFLIIIFFFYYFINSTINLCNQICFCPLNKKITFSDILLFINDILCIIDIIISFFRAYYNFEYKLVKINYLIIIHYLKWDFIFDLLSAIPIFSISKYICSREIIINRYFKYEMSNNFIFLKLCSLLKTLKIVKMINHKKKQSNGKIL